MQTLWPTTTTPPPLAENEAHIWAVPLAVDEATSQQLLATLSMEESTQAEQFRLEAPRRTFIVGRVALRTLLAHYLEDTANHLPAIPSGSLLSAGRAGEGGLKPSPNVKPRDIVFEFDNLGKPRLAPAINPTDIRFNVSHSGDLALIAVTRGCEVGVDVERIRDVGQLAQIAARFFHPDESAAIAAAPSNEQREVFLRCWTAKEAILKACGKGITAELHTFAVPLTAEYEGWLELPPSKDSATGVRYWPQRFVPCNGYLAAAAFIGKQRRTRYYSFQNPTDTTQAEQ